MLRLWKRWRHRVLSTCPEGVSEAAAKLCETLTQGDVVALESLPIVMPGRLSTHVLTPEHVAIVSQTCDIVQKTKSMVLVAAIVRLEGNSAANARAGKQPRYVPVPQLGNDAFVDLDLISTLSKDCLVGSVVGCGLNRDDLTEVRDFARRIGRRFSRFPFPDEISPWLQPLQAYVQTKHDKNSALGLLLREITELRMEADDWSSPGPFSLTLHVIVKAGTVPSLEDIDFSDCPPELSQWLGENRELSGIANRLLKVDDSVERYYLWSLGVSEAFRNVIEKAGAALGPSAGQSAVRSISCQLWSDDEFPLSKMRKTEMLDLDHLSSAPPL